MNQPVLIRILLAGVLFFSALLSISCESGNIRGARQFPDTAAQFKGKWRALPLRKKQDFSLKMSFNADGTFELDCNYLCYFFNLIKLAKKNTDIKKTISLSGSWKIIDVNKVLVMFDTNLGMSHASYEIEYKQFAKISEPHLIEEVRLLYDRPEKLSYFYIHSVFEEGVVTRLLGFNHSRGFYMAVYSSD